MKTRGMADSPLFRDKEITKKGIGISTKLSPHYSIKPSYYLESLIPIISQTIQEVGREVCTYRLTQQEKANLIEIIYQFRKKNIKISENDIARIGINYMIQDFKQFKKDSILSRVLNGMPS